MLLTQEEKEKMAEENYKLIFYVIQKFQSIGISFDELESIGGMGYTKALNAFDTDKNVKFSTFAINCIKNEILFFLRKEKQHILNNVSLSKVLSVDKNGNNLSLEDILPENDGSHNSLEDEFMLGEDIRLLTECIEHLSPKEKLIITYRFGLGNQETKTQKEIAELIDMSQANVSKMEKTIIFKLRRLYGKKVMG